MSTSTLGLFLRHLDLSGEASRLGTTSDHDTRSDDSRRCVLFRGEVSR